MKKQTKTPARILIKKTHIKPFADYLRKYDWKDSEFDDLEQRFVDEDTGEEVIIYSSLQGVYDRFLTSLEK